MKRKYLPICKRVFAVLFVVAVLLYNIPFPIHKEVSAMEIKLDDPAYEKVYTVDLDCSYHFNLFAGNVLSGQISVPEYPLTYENMRAVWFDKYHTGTVTYTKESHAFGLLFGKSLFWGKPIMLLYERHQAPDGSYGDGWSSENGRCLVAGAENRQQALQTLANYDIFPVE